MRLVNRGYNEQAIHVPALWHHLGLKRRLPWHLSLRVELDGLLEERVHPAVVHADGGACGHVSCSTAFRLLVGKQFVAWRFMQPHTLVFAVKGVDR